MNKIGGAYVDEGSFGCVYRPPLRCKGSSERPKNKVSKLMKKDDAIKEHSITNVIDKIDNTYKYHLKRPTICKPAKPDKKIDNNLHECFVAAINGAPQEKGWKDRFRILQYKDGGVSMDNILKSIFQGNKDLNRMKLIASLENLFYGLKDMYEHEFLHGDIKDENILFNKKTYRFNFIDFGLSYMIDNFDKLTEDDFIPSIDSIHYPMDIVFTYNEPVNNLFLEKELQIYSSRETFFSLLRDRRFDDIRSVMKYLFRTSNKKHYNSRFIKNGKKEEVKSTEEHANLYMDGLKLNQYYSLYREMGERNFKIYILKSVDTYSFGIFLIELWGALKREKFDIQRKPNNLTMIESMFYDIIKGYTNSNIKDRLSPIEGYRIFLKMLELINRELKKDNKATIKPSRKRERRQTRKIRKKELTLIDEDTRHIRRQTQTRRNKFKDIAFRDRRFTRIGKYEDCPEDEVYNIISQQCIHKDHPNAKRIKKIGLYKTIKREKVGRHLRKAKDCPTGEVLNIISKNCVDKDGKLGRRIINLRLAPRKQLTKKDIMRHTKKRKKRPIYRQCPQGQIYNPISQNCIQEDSTIAKRLKKVGIHKRINREKVNKALQKAPQCPPGQVYNIASNQCVMSDGDIGKRLQQLGLVKK